MKDQESLYFDIWRKANFKDLLRAYTAAVENYNDGEIATGFGNTLDTYVEGGKKKYTGTPKQWSSAYTLGRELGIFKDGKDRRYVLSNLAMDFLKSKIVSHEYLLIYLLNLNQLINGKVVHPLNEVLQLFNENKTIEKSSIYNIEKFHLYKRTLDNRSQITNILLNRMIDAKIIRKSPTKGHYELYKYPLEQLIESCVTWSKSSFEFEKLTHNDYVEMVSAPNTIIKLYRLGG
ncbi:hypothetical protein [Paenibacillus amylolyticus]|uniref:Uncharacterized protein n=1 Tax=Paenibacillus amylolyticus TaxID=1451 RepID=A0A117I2F3_PAEAM|nr:hypothetical protein [Paenibacillus amylolyticus]GAS83747.1 unknown protein [Paenibacillus amylolyticus]